MSCTFYIFLFLLFIFCVFMAFGLGFNAFGAIYSVLNLTIIIVSYINIIVFVYRLRMNNSIEAMIIGEDDLDYKPRYGMDNKLHMSFTMSMAEELGLVLEEIQKTGISTLIK